METNEDPIAPFHDLGGLHEARVLWVSWGEGESGMGPNTLHANFRDGTAPSAHFPDCSARPATLVFTGVKDVAGRVRQEAGHISDMEIARLRDCYRVSIVGTDTWMFAFDCVSVGLEPAGEPASVDAHYGQLKA